jgi:glycosyltransferase involved in cell wall biosynthesis
VRQSENLGAVENFKFVLDEAVGEYFMWAAADDVWSTNWIHLLLSVSESHDCCAFGVVKTIDCNGSVINHPANNRKYTFNGPRAFRRLKYFLSPSMNGKANVIYGIFKVSIIRSGDFEVFGKYKSGSDMLFVYSVLNYTDIFSTENAVLSKRVHAGCLGCGGGKKSKRKRISRRLFGFLVYQMRNPRYAMYFVESKIIDKLTITVAYPIAIVVATMSAVLAHASASARGAGGKLSDE